jgi:hypothetical protein
MVSKIGYIELIDSNNQNVYKIYLKNGTGQGDFFIPTTLKTGDYKLVAYTTWMLNRSVTALFQVSISIINPFQFTRKEFRQGLWN